MSISEMAPRTGKAAALLSLHQPGNPLLLPNVWDAASARLVEAAGYPAVATGSAAVAEVLGYADSEATPVDEMFGAVARIARSVTVPVTADLERGYRLRPAELVERIAAAGVVGCNLEDSVPSTGLLVDVDEQADFLAVVRQAATEAGIGLVINARIDVFLRGTGPHRDHVEEAVRRAESYRAAGADCVYPILLREADLIRSFVASVGGPVNILVAPDEFSAGYADLGVARLSCGSKLYQAAYQQVAGMVAQAR